ncbi:MAG: cation:proton antiporter [Kiritimatiellae bacterium]|nr:cation:proton antiporter [Kiritimatiellia bacterium]
MSESAFFQDLAVLMAVAGAVAGVFGRFGWPKVIGYILAGVVLGEHTWGGSLLADVGSTRTVGQLGVVFLMFGMGLSFSPKEVRRVRSVAVPAAVFDTVMMTWIGYIVGTRLFGWPAVPSLFLGVAICDSATTLLAKVFDELGWSNRPLATNVLGTSLCEDVICVGAIAVVTGVASGGGMSLGALGMSLGSLFLFFFTVLVFGFVLVPRLLDSIGRRGDGESLVLVALGVCFFVSYLAYLFHFSLALGAFLVGLVGATSGMRHRLVSLAAPLKAMFSAVFFVSIGLLVDPSALLRHLPEVAAVAAVIVAGKTSNIFLASVAAGADVRTAVQHGLALAQTGEFAFMVAMLYATLTGDFESPLFQVAVGASLLTVLLNPLLVRVSERAGAWAESKVPPGVEARLVSYRAWLERIRASRGSPAFRSLRLAAVKLGVYAVLVFAASVVCTLLGAYDYSGFSEFLERHDDLLFFVLANLFDVAVFSLVPSAARSLGDAVSVLLAGDGDSKWQTHLRPLVRHVSTTAAVALFFLEWTMINLSIVPQGGAVRIGASVVVVAAGVVGWRLFSKAGRRASQRFHEALTAEERREGMAAAMTVPAPPGDVHRLVLGAGSPAVGGTVVTLNIRAKTGASVVAVVRDGQVTRNVGPEWEFRIGDELLVLGDARQTGALKDLLGVT